MAGNRNKQLSFCIIVIDMKPFKIILGIIIIILGLGMAAAGWATAVYGQGTLVVKTFLGFTLVFLGSGLGWSGLMLIRGSTVKEALGGIVTARSGQSGVGLHKEDIYYVPPNNLKDILLDILKYTIIAIVVILIATFSVFRVIGGFPG